jgi:hypothetical protein
MLLSRCLVVTAVLAAGCGGGDEPSAEDRQPVRIPAALTESVDRVCRDMTEQLEELGTRPARRGDQEGYLEYTNGVAAILLDGVRQHQSLRLPRGEAGVLAKRAIAETERRVERFNDVSEELLTAVVERGDVAAAQRRYAEALTPELHAPLREDLRARSCSFDYRESLRT